MLSSRKATKKLYAALPLASIFYLTQINLFNSIFQQKTDSRNNIQLNTKLIIQHY